MKCEEIKELITLYVLGDLDSSIMKEINAHLKQCEKCWTYTNRIRTTIELVKDALTQTSVASQRLPETKRALIMQKQLAPLKKGLWLSGTQLMRLSVIASAAALLLVVFLILPAISSARVKAKAIQEKTKVIYMEGLKASSIPTPKPASPSPVLPRGGIRRYGGEAQPPTISINEGVDKDDRISERISSSKESEELELDSKEVLREIFDSRRHVSRTPKNVPRESSAEMFARHPIDRHGSVPLAKEELSEIERSDGAGVMFEAKDEAALDYWATKTRREEVDKIVKESPSPSAESTRKRILKEGAMVDKPADAKVGGGDEKDIFSSVAIVKSPILMRSIYGSRTKSSTQYFNPFIIPSAQPVSTFSIDVDTASYTMSRNYMLVKKLRPPPELVRTEEFINYFDYGYKPPSAGTFAIYVDGAPSKFKPDLHLLKIGVKGRRLGREERRIAVLTCLIDTSGSMDQPERIGMVKKALRLLIENLNQRDHIAILTFDTTANFLLTYTPAEQKDKILTAIDSIKCGGDTNMSEGFLLAYQLASKNFISGAENRVVVMSDGLANLGHTEADDILRIVKKYTDEGIYCSIYGVGTKSYNDAMLQRLANKGNGVYAFIDSEAEAKRLFVDELSASINTIAADVKIQVEFNPVMVERYRLLGYEKRQLKKEDFRDNAVDAGEVGSGQSATALYELQLKSTRPIYYQNVLENILESQRRSQIAVVRIRYKRVDTGAIEEIEQRISVADFVDNFERAGVYFRLASAVAEFAELLRNSPYAGNGSFEAVSRVLDRVSTELHWDKRIQELAQLVRIAPTLSYGG